MFNNRVFRHNETGELCQVTRFYNNKNWYYKKVKDPKQEIRGVSNFQTLRFFYTPAKEFKVGARVKIDQKFFKSSPMAYSETFKNFISDNADTIFKITEVSNLGSFYRLNKSEFLFHADQLKEYRKGE